MAAKRTYVFDKKLQAMVETTPAKDLAVIELLEKDTKRVRKGLKPLRISRSGNSGYPYYSWNIGADSPEEKAQLQKKLRDHGIDMELNGDGDLKIESEPHRQRVLDALELYDRNGVKSPRNR